MTNDGIRNTESRSTQQGTDMTQPIEINLDAIAHGGEAIGRHAGQSHLRALRHPGRARTDRDRRGTGSLGAGAGSWTCWNPALIALRRPAPTSARTRVRRLPVAAHRLSASGRAQAGDRRRSTAPPGAHRAAARRRHRRPGRSGRGRRPSRSFLEYGYRNNVQFALTPEGRLGFRRAASHDVVRR